MFIKNVIHFSLICFAVVLVGCSALLSQQEWSENYSLLEGATSTSPSMIDGDINTIGETSLPATASSAMGSNPAPEVVITLPEEKVIRRIVIHSENLKTFDIFADQGGIVKDTDWKLIKEIKTVESNPIEIPVLISHPTNRIRLRVLSTTDDANLKRSQRARSGGGGVRAFGQNRRAQGKIKEIELYGYKTVEQTKQNTAAENREKELDDLLNTE